MAVVPRAILVSQAILELKATLVLEFKAILDRPVLLAIQERRERLVLEFKAIQEQMGTLGRKEIKAILVLESREIPEHKDQQAIQVYREIPELEIKAILVL